MFFLFSETYMLLQWCMLKFQMRSVYVQNPCEPKAQASDRSNLSWLLMVSVSADIPYTVISGTKSPHQPAVQTFGLFGAVVQKLV